MSATGLVTEQAAQQKAANSKHVLAPAATIVAPTNLGSRSYLTGQLSQGKWPWGQISAPILG
jgi:hypothetical protein